MGLIRKCGLFVLSLGLLFTGSFGLLSDNVSAVSEYDDTFIFYNAPEDYYLNRYGDPSQQYYFEQPLWEEIKDATGADASSDAFADLLEERFIDHNGDNVTVMFDEPNTTIQIRIYNLEDTFFFETAGGARQLSSIATTRQTLTMQYSPWQGRDLIINGQVSTSNGNHSILGSNPLDCNTFCMRPYYMNLNIPVYPSGYEGDLLDGQNGSETIIIRPKPLLTVKDKVIEVNQTRILEHILRDHNILWQNRTAYVTYIIWELDEYGDTIGDPIHVRENILENREFSYTFGEYGTYRLAVSYTWPSVIPLPIAPEGTDIVYEPFGFEMHIDGRVYNQGWDHQACIEGYCLGNNENLVDKCITETFPFVDIGGCIGITNSFISMLTFRTPEPDELGGGVFHDAVNGCRQLQVLDTWLFRPNQTVCPSIPTEVRNTVTPFITFAFGLMAITFIARRQGVRSLD